ncbi:alpha/beta fold hydrolase [Denitromonas ohlonensis]|nr:alpha/beta hydrolase [Denitromonas ohlonensis]
MDSIEQGVVEANGVSFHYLAQGEGPLALLLHGFPDTAQTWRHLMPQLASRGYRAVAPFMRGYAPTQAPDMNGLDAMSLFLALGGDANGLHGALGGDASAVLIGHDWGAVATYSAVLQAPERWRRCVTLAVPPLQIFGPRHSQYAQLKRSFYMWFFQMAAANEVVRANDFAFIRALWADWSPGYDAEQDVLNLQRSLAAAENLEAAIGYYRAFFNAEQFSFAYGDAVGPISRPLLYLHGSTDGCVSLDHHAVAEAQAYAGAGSAVALMDGCGHFLHLEKPDEVGQRIDGFLGAP